METALMTVRQKVLNSTNVTDGTGSCALQAVCLSDISLQCVPNRLMALMRARLCWHVERLMSTALIRVVGFIFSLEKTGLCTSRIKRRMVVLCGLNL